MAMQRRRFGPTGADIPVIGQGTWRMESDDRKAAVAALQRGIELGMTHIDTAELYGSGKVEQIVREAIRGKRESIYLVSKVMPSNASRGGTIQACERSLKYLGTTHLDCYLLHWPGSHALEDTLGAFETLVEQGKIRSYGVSNFDEQELARAVRIAGAGRIACNQVLYHLEERAIEHAVLPYCEQQGIAVVGYTPFGTGLFPPKGASGTLVREIAARHSATPHRVALAFLTRRPSLFAIPKASSAQHTADNAGAGDLVLEPSELTALEDAFPLGRKRRGIPML
jgi:diketogulonate reductase-like aldo/keto reductase